MCEELRLERYDNSSWGFRLTGGLDFGTPLSIIKVTGGSIAEEAGIQAGDLVKCINGKPTTHFTHLDAQKCIAASGNYLTLTVIRGSVVTPPMTPLRGLSPAPSYKTEETQYNHDSPLFMKTDAENAIMDYYNKKFNMRDGSRSPVPVQQKTAGQKATLTNDKHQYRLNDEGQLFLGDRQLTEFELAELLTSNEEVLDEGVLGINFKKFLPQVDFIRKSEVFKMLQSENTKKDLSEQAQLQKEPNKRFSTFLMKPRIPTEPPLQLEFVRFKPPRYLPKPPEPKWELPKLKPWERPKKKEPEHSVLWLFMEEKGEDIIDERYGTDEEERINLSRNSQIEYDRSTMSSRMSDHIRTHEDDSWSTASRDQYQDHLDFESHVSTKEEKMEEENMREKVSRESGEFTENQNVSKKPKLVMETEIQDREIQSNITSRSCSALTNIEERKKKISMDEERIRKESAVNFKLVEQLTEIQNQIEALENEAPSDLLTQLLAVKKQLSKIVEIKTSEEVVKKVEEGHEHKLAERSLTSSDVKASSDYSKQHHVYESHKECRYEETSSSVEEVFEATLSSSAQESMRASSNHEPMTSGGFQESMRSSSFNEGSLVEKKEFSEQKSEKHIDVSTYQVEELEETEVKLCITPSPKAEPKKKKKRAAHPITPQTRPIILPGGRMWRQPKDAEHEEFYQGILVAQAEVLVGTNVTLNYTKYMPPEVDMTTSEVYRLIHEMEDEKKDDSETEKIEYCEPISKRHFYAATLREPPPIGVVELIDL